jgi:hypothetical protein
MDGKRQALSDPKGSQGETVEADKGSECTVAGKERKYLGAVAVVVACECRQKRSLA